LGIAAFGALANAVLGSGGPDPARLTTAVHRVIIVIVALAVVMVATAALLPRDRPVRADPAPDPRD
jgi:hypothetical protein